MVVMAHGMAAAGASIVMMKMRQHCFLLPVH